MRSARRLFRCDVARAGENIKNGKHYALQRGMKEPNETKIEKHETEPG